MVYCDAGSIGKLLGRIVLVPSIRVISEIGSNLTLAEKLGAAMGILE